MRVVQNHSQLKTHFTSIEHSGILIDARARMALIFCVLVRLPMIDGDLFRSRIIEIYASQLTIISCQYRTVPGNAMSSHHRISSIRPLQWTNRLGVPTTFIANLTKPNNKYLKSFQTTINSPWYPLKCSLWYSRFAPPSKRKARSVARSLNSVLWRSPSPRSPKSRTQWHLRLHVLAHLDSQMWDRSRSHI